MAFVWFRVQRLGQADFSRLGDLLLWLVPPLAIVLYLRLRKSPTATRQSSRRSDATRARLFAPVGALFARLERAGLQPRAGETTAQYLRRAAPEQANGVTLQEILADYYRLRFDAQAQTADLASALADKVERYLTGWPQRTITT